MFKWHLAFVLLLTSSWLSGWLWWHSSATPYRPAEPFSPIETPGPTSTFTVQPSPTLSSALSPTPSSIPSLTPTATATPSPLMSPSPTSSPTPARLVAGKVFLDTNRNLVQDPGEPGLAGITAYLRQGDQLFGQTVTDAMGEFHFSDMVPGLWLLGIEVPPGLELINMAVNPMPIVVTEMTSIYLPFALAPLPTPEPPASTATATVTVTGTIVPTATPSATPLPPSSPSPFPASWHIWLALVSGSLPAHGHTTWLPLIVCFFL